MIPSAVRFTELEVDPSTLLHARTHPGPYPLDWHRVAVKYESINTRDLSEWTLANTHGRFGIVKRFYPNVVLYFEDYRDAVLFQMKDGASASLETKNPPRII